MTIFIIGVVLAVAVASTYVTLGVRDFLRIRREVGRAAAADGGVAAESSGEASLDAGRETVGFAWRALGGVVCSVALLYLISHAWWAWYLFPALALGTGVAVSIAFVIDPTKTR
jgi:hypothetical protein